MQLFTQATINKLTQKVAPNGSAHADWQRLLARVDIWCAQSPELPTQSGGWIHNYICPTHWLPLIYDGDAPSVHRCPAGDDCTGAIYDEAWRAWRHRQFADMSRDIALAYAVTGEARYLAEVERILLQYAAFYANFVGADSAEVWMITARVFNQALTESLWAIPLIHAFDLVSTDLPLDARQQIEQDFLRPLADTISQAQDALIKQDHVDSNYMGWFNAVLGCLGYVLNDVDLVARAIDGSGGFIKHLTIGVLADGMQYEVTPYYHNFVVLAYQILAEAAHANGRDLYGVRGENGQSIQSMWRALTQLTLPDGTLADLGDGSYWINSVYDRELSEVYEIAQAHDNDPAVAATLQNAYARKGSGRDNWAALLFGKEALAPSTPQEEGSAMRVLPDAGVAVLQSSPQLAAVVPFGAYRGSHSHGDPLSLQVWPFSNDAGCVLYGLPARMEWYRDAYAHNGLVIDGESPQLWANAQSHIAERQIQLCAADLFAGKVSRTIETTPTQIIDLVTVSAETPHQYDWVFHVDGQLVLENLKTQPHAEMAAAQHIKLTERVAGVESADFTITHNDQTYTLQLRADTPFDLLLGNAPGTSWNPTERRRVIIGRTTGMTQRYRTTISHV